MHPESNTSFTPDEHPTHLTHHTVAPGSAPAHVTVLLHAAASGDRAASEEILPLVYDELRRLAQANMGREMRAGAGHTLQPTALVHEAYMRLVGSGNADWASRGHFFGAAALAMRRILIERARARHAAKRGGGAARVELREDAVAFEPAGEAADAKAAELIALDQALDQLKALDERAAQIVMLRYFTGLSIEQTAAATGLSPATVKKSWAFARAWLNRKVAQSAAPDADA